MHCHPWYCKATAQSLDSLQVERDSLWIIEARMRRQVASLEQKIDDYQHRFDQLEKQIDDLMWFRRLEDIAFIVKVRLTGSPRWKPKSENDRFAGNKLQFYAYLFIPKKVEWKKKHPLIVLPHSGIHNFSTYYYHIVRELIAQGYVVRSAEYRGSTGYGKNVREHRLRGRKTTMLASRDYMIENYPIVDSTRVGVVHGATGARSR